MKKPRRPNLPPWPKAQTERGPNGRLLCRCGCGREVPPRRRSWHGPECLEKVRLTCDWNFVRKHVAARDKGICQCCGLHAESYRAEVREAYASGNFIPLEEANIKGFPPLHRPWQQIDHIVPVCEGGANLDLKNLRTVCVPCHKKLTKQLNHDRRLKKAQRLLPPAPQPSHRPPMPTLSDSTFTEAASAGSLDDACVIIQAAIGQKDGGPASVFFSSRSTEEEWAGIPVPERIAVLREYAAYETDAFEIASANP